MAREPGVVVFKETVPVSPSPATPKKEPGALSLDMFPATPAPSPSPRTPPTPAPLQFTNRPTAPAAPLKPVGQPLFNAQAHPSQGSAQAEAAALDARLYAENSTQINRLISQLLPFKKEGVEQWAATPLSQCKDTALAAARHTQDFAALNAAAQLDDLVRSLSPKSGLIERFKGKFAPSPQERNATLRHLQAELLRLLEEVRALRPTAEQQAARLASHLVALRAVTTAVGLPSEQAFASLLDQRLATLRAALTQATLTPAHLKATEETLVLQLAQCDRLLTVTFSAVALAHGARSRD